MRQVIASVACWALSAMVLGSVGFVAWACSSDKRAARVESWIRRWKGRLDR